MIKRRTFVTLATFSDAHEREWEIGRQDDPVGVGDSIVIFTACVACGRPIGTSMTVFGTTSLAHGLSGQCRHVGQVPAAVSLRARSFADRLHEESWKIRAEGGGSRLSIPDC